MPQRKRVLWLIKGLGMGGAERLLELAVPYFDKDRYEYEVAYCVPQKNDLVPELERADIPVFCLNSEHSYDARVAFRLFRLLRERKPDILHTHLPYTGVLGRVVGRLSGIKGVVYTEHNVMTMYHPITRALNLVTYPLNQRAIAVSEEVYRSVARYPMPRAAKPVVISNGISVDLHNSSARVAAGVKEALGVPLDHRVVGSVAHIRPEKGQEYLVEAAKLVMDRNPRVAFVIVGREKTDGEIRRLEDLAAGLGIRDRIVFTGFRRDVYDLVNAFDVFTLSSLHEGLPLALLEAMALSKPPVATSVGGVPEVIKDGVNGFLVPPRDPQLLAQKILQLLANDDLRHDMGRKAAETVRERFGIQEMVRKVEQVYASVLAGD